MAYLPSLTFLKLPLRVSDVPGSIFQRPQVLWPVASVVQQLLSLVCGVAVSPALKVNPLVLYLLQPASHLSSHCTKSQACKSPRDLLYNPKWNDKRCITEATMVLCSSPCTLPPLLSVRWLLVMLAPSLRRLTVTWGWPLPYKGNRKLQDSSLEPKESAGEMAIWGKNWFCQFWVWDEEILLYNYYWDPIWGPGLVKCGTRELGQ